MSKALSRLTFLGAIVVFTFVAKTVSVFKSYNRIYLVDSNSLDQQDIRKELRPDLTFEKASGTFDKHKNHRYTPDWKSLDSRPLPSWYDQSKIGIFIHWGVFSVPGLESEWFWKTWKGIKAKTSVIEQIQKIYVKKIVKDGRKECVEYMKNYYKPGFTYQEFAPMFTAEFFNSTEWAELFGKSGAKYVVLTSKHHEGFTLWPSKYSFSWNAMSVGPHRDIIDELSSAIREKTSIRFGLYHSLYEWYNPLWLNDKKNNLTTNEFVRFKTLPELYEIVNKYKPEVVWSDGEWEAPDSYWQSKVFLAWLYNDSPVKNTVVVNDRWGHETLCHHGGYYTCADRFNPGVLQPHKWENCMTLDKDSWGFRRNADIEDYLTEEELITTIVESVACGGNVLVNVGPTREGMIPPIQQERLIQMGQWLKNYGEAIYDTIPWSHQNDTITKGIWYTSNLAKTKVYATITTGSYGEVEFGAINSTISVQELSTAALLDFWSSSKGTTVFIPSKLKQKLFSVYTIVFHFN